MVTELGAFDYKILELVSQSVGKVSLISVRARMIKSNEFFRRRAVRGYVIILRLMSHKGLIIYLVSVVFSVELLF